jgi:hypothetical protein
VSDIDQEQALRLGEALAVAAHFANAQARARALSGLATDEGKLAGDRDRAAAQMQSELARGELGTLLAIARGYTRRERQLSMDRPSAGEIKPWGQLVQPRPEVLLPRGIAKLPTEHKEGRRHVELSVPTYLAEQVVSVPKELAPDLPTITAETDRASVEKGRLLPFTGKADSRVLLAFPLENYAKICARLSKGEARQEVLGDFQLDEVAWNSVSQHWGAYLALDAHLFDKFHRLVREGEGEGTDTERKAR